MGNKLEIAIQQIQKVCDETNECANKHILQDGINQVKELQKENNVLKGIESGSSTHRCAYCEDFYADEENPLDEYDSKPICKDCHINVLKEED